MFKSVGQSYEDKSLGLQVHDLIYFTTDLQTENYYSTFSARTALFLKFRICELQKLFACWVPRSVKSYIFPGSLVLEMH